MRHRSPPVGSGQQLLADFQTAFVSAATIQAAQYEADRSENALLDHLAAVSGGTYLQPGNLSPDEQTDLTRSSLDAHVKKVQAQQLNAISAQQLQELQEYVKNTYIGRRVTAHSLHPKSGAIETVWFDQRAGFRNNATRKQKVTGVIQDILLDRNVLILKPTFTAKLINSNLENYMIYVIDPVSLKPLVDLTLD
ncbi:MAG TPA: hypothetical protein VGE30_00890 [Candidatus Saccharimonadales bacterium]